MAIVINDGEFAERFRRALNANPFRQSEALGILEDFKERRAEGYVPARHELLLANRLETKCTERGLTA